MRLGGRVVLVTGGAVRIGRAIALAAAQEGATVAVHYHTSQIEAQATVAACHALGSEAMAVQADLRQGEDVARMVERVGEELGGLYGVVNNAGVFYRTPIEDIADAHWAEMLALHVMAPWWTIRSALPLFRRGTGGKVVNILDCAIDKPNKGYLPYVVSKAGLMAMTRAMAKEFAPTITVNAVAPGFMVPPESLTDQARAALVARTPLQRWGSAEDVAAAVMFFLAGTDYATGSILQVDGGVGIA